MREVTTKGVGWASEEASDLVVSPLSLVLYMHLRIFAYTLNTLIASFEYMELMLASGTLKNFRFLLRSCLSTDRAPVIKLTCSTFQPWHCITVLITLRRDAYWFSAVLLTLMRYRSQASDILFFPRYKRSRPCYPRVGGPLLRPVASARNFPHDCLFWNPLFDSFIFYRCEGTSHLARAAFHIVSCVRFKYGIMILELGCNFIPYSLEAFLA